MDILAYVILGLAFFFGLSPCIADTIMGGGTRYLESVKLGAMVTGLVIGFGIMVFAICWAILHVLA